MAGAATRFSSYEEACAQHRWDVPEHYNIAEDVCDKHPPDKLAMIHEHFRGDVREVALGRAAGDEQPLRQRPARPRRREGRPRGDAAAADAGDRRGVLRHVEVRRDPALDVGALRRRRDPPPGAGLAGQGARHRPRQRRARRPRGWSSTSCCSTTRACWTARDDAFDARGHARRRPGAALLLLRHHGAGQGHPPRPPLPARPRGVRLLPRRAGGRAASTAWASGRGRRASRRCSARGGSAPCSSSTSARAASTRTSSSTCSRATAPPTCSRRRRRCAR